MSNTDPQKQANQAVANAGKAVTEAVKAEEASIKDTLRQAAAEFLDKSAKAAEFIEKEAAQTAKKVRK